MNIHVALLKARLLAFLIDYLIIVVYGLCLAGITFLVYNIALGSIPDLINTIGPFGTQLIGFITLTLPVGLYFYFTESGKYHASVGKRVLKIKIQNTGNFEVTKKQIAVRTIIKFLPWEFAHTFVHQVVFYSQNNGTPPVWVMVGLTIANLLPLIYVGMIIFRKDHRGPHDLVAKTLVVSTK